MKITVGFEKLLSCWNAGTWKWDSRIVWVVAGLLLFYLEVGVLWFWFVWSLFGFFVCVLLKHRTAKDLISEENQNSGSSYIFLIKTATKTWSSVWVHGDTALSYFISLPFYLESPYLLLENFWGAQWVYILTLMPCLSRIMVLCLSLEYGMSMLNKQTENKILYLTEKP